jgi:hypothetical protein
MILKQCKYIYVCNNGKLYFLTKPLLNSNKIKVNTCNFSFNNSSLWKKKKEKLYTNIVELFYFRNKF